MIEYVYSGAEELGGFIFIGFGLVCIVILFIADFIWKSYQNRKKGDKKT